MPPEATWRVWYDSLIKPSWTPPGSTIGIIWSILYPMIAVSFLYVLVQTIKRKLPKKIFFVFLVNLIANFLYSPIFFGMKNISLATLNIAVVWMTIVMQFFLMWKKKRWVSFLQIPYFIWVSTASVIQFTVFFSN